MHYVIGVGSALDQVAVLDLLHGITVEILPSVSGEQPSTLLGRHRLVRRICDNPVEGRGLCRVGFGRLTGPPQARLASLREPCSAGPVRAMNLISGPFPTSVLSEPAEARRQVA
jgi:hypothetical protein